jgi:predicted kinase
VVLVSGAPGAGKSTLAWPLAAELGFALLTKDLIKETLHDELGAPVPDLAWSRWLGGAAMGLLWVLAAQAPEVVIEANFRPRSDYERAKIAGLVAGGGQLVEVHCRCPAPVAAARYAERSATRHPVHVVATVSGDFLTQFDRPVGLGQLIEVDTTVPLDVAAVASRVRARLAGVGAPGLAAATSESPRTLPPQCRPMLPPAIIRDRG